MPNVYIFPAQNAIIDMGDDKIIWCVISQEEMFKCQNFSAAVKKDKVFLGPDYLDLECVQVRPENYIFLQKCHLGKKIYYG
jgi:hypothetical protein